MGNKQPKCTPQEKKAYFEFIREFRRKNCEMQPSLVFLRAAKAWRKLTDEERKQYADKTSECSIAKPKCSVARKPACKLKKKPACKRKPPKKPTKRACKKPPKKKLCKPRKPRARAKPCVPIRPAGIRRCKPKQPKKLSCPKRKRGFLGAGKRDGGGDCKKLSDEVAKQCMRPGPVMSNGFLNFMREFRTKNCGLDPTTTLKRGARAWCRLCKKEKDQFRQADYALTQRLTRKSS